MRPRWTGAVAALGVAATATAAATAHADSTIQQPVMGGSAVPDGKWPDTAVVLIGGLAECTGVLVAPTVVLTAGHCDDAQLEEVIVGANDLSQVQEGERIGVAARILYPDFVTMYDVTALVLERESRIEPRAIATGWARFDIVDGARVELVGFGAIDRDATQYVDELQEVETTITDADCSTEGVGCNAAVRPAGELGAGGMGKDTCPGDSGGPLYLLTPYGDFLAGLTSRAYITSPYYCQDGGIYVRADAIVDWIEAQTGAQVARGPEPRVDELAVVRGDGAQTGIDINDPVGEDHELEITVEPLHGRVRVRDDGEVRYCANPDYVGTDAFAVTITDDDAPERSLALTVPVTIVDGIVPAEECSMEFEGEGCCSGSRPGAGGLLLVAVVGGAIGRRRRRGRRPSLRTDDRRARALARGRRR